MKAITQKEKMPKFLKANSYLPSRSYNKYLPKPYTLGELVKVAPWEEQKRSTIMDDVLSPEVINKDPKWFHENYVVIYRKDDEGNWSIKNTMPWYAFDLLTLKK